MAIFGSSAADEEALRAAALLNDQDQTTVDRSSAYETASEYNSEYNSAYELEDEILADRKTNLHPEHNTQSAVPDNRDSGVSVPSPDLQEKPVEASQTPVPADAPRDAPLDTSREESPDQPQRYQGDDNSFSEDRLNRIASQNDTLSNIERLLSHSQSHDDYIDPKDLDWDGPDDKDNALNWPAWKKWYATFTVAIVCLCASLGSSLYVESVPYLTQEMHASQTLCIAGLTFYLIGLALGPLLTAPLSEMIGRRWIYVCSLPMSMLFTMGVGLSSKIREILVLRFFAGYLASPPMSIAAGTISDVWGNDPADMSIAMALFCVAPFLGPVVGPIVGGFAAEHKGWKWTQWVTLMFCGAILPFIVLCPETYKPAILKARAKKRGIKLIQPKIDAAYFKTVVRVNLIRPVEMLLVEPIVFATSVYTAFVFAVLFGFFEAYPIIFRGVYRMDVGVSGLTFIGVGIGLVGGVVLYILIPHKRFFPLQPDGRRGRRDENGNMIWDAPETRLVVAQFASVFLPIALFWLGWSARPSVHWICPTFAGVPFGFGLIWIFFGVILYYSMSFPPQYVASAVAANNLLRYVMASVFPLFTVQMYQRLGIGWASSLLAFIAVGMVPIPFFFSKYGQKMRQISKYGYAAFFKNLAAKVGPEEAARLMGRPLPKKPETTSPSTDQEKEGEQASSEEDRQEDEKRAANQV